MHSFCSHPDREVVKLAIATELLLFMDLIPGYRMRIDDDSSKGVKVYYHHPLSLYITFFFVVKCWCSSAQGLRETVSYVLSEVPQNIRVNDWMFKSYFCAFLAYMFSLHLFIDSLSARINEACCNSVMLSNVNSLSF